MIQYLLEKFEHIQKQRNLYCENIKNTTIKAEPSSGAVVHPVEPVVLSKKTIFIYDFICENTQGKGPTTK
jgi:hypothetical protein